MERKMVIGLAAQGLLTVGGVVAWADEAPTPKADAATAPVDAALADAQDPQAAHAQQQAAAPAHSAVAADSKARMHEEMVSSRAHQMGMEHGAQQMHDEMTRDRQMPQQMGGMPAAGAQGGGAMKMGNPCSGSGCKAGDAAPAPMPMGHR